MDLGVEVPFRSWFAKRSEKGAADPQVSVWFSRGSAAAELWRFGEDELADRVLALPDDAWAQVLELASYYRNPLIEVPVVKTKGSNGHTMCFACMHQVEGAVRPLAFM